MINHFVKPRLLDPSNGNLPNISQQTRNSLVLGYPCSSNYKCTPYVLDLPKGNYKFECWGSKGNDWNGKSTPGFGGYTSGTVFVPKLTTFYVFIGTIGAFNGVKSYSSAHSAISGGATDVRLNISENWWDTESLLSRIMVAAGGGGSEWTSSIGGHGGGLQGGSSVSATSEYDIETYPYPCKGATQTYSSTCNENPELESKTGDFGFALPCSRPMEYGNDYGGFGGGGYYGGTSYAYAYAGSGGSSFISGYPGCKAVKNNKDTIEHEDHPIHYSGFVFSKPEMISGNKTMPLPSSPTEKGIHSSAGAFRITLVQYQYHCTYKKHLSLLPFLHLFYYQINKL